MADGKDQIAVDYRASGDVVDDGKRRDVAGARQRIVPGGNAVLRLEREQFARAIGYDDGVAGDTDARAGKDFRAFHRALMFPQSVAIAGIESERLVFLGDDIDAAVDDDRSGVDGNDSAHCPQRFAGFGVERHHGAEAGGGEQLSVFIGDAAARAFGGIERIAAEKSEPAAAARRRCRWGQGS